MPDPVQEFLDHAAYERVIAPDVLMNTSEEHLSMHCME